jgi:hypothetical protein
MVEYCLKNNIIKPYQIKYCIISSLTIPANYYNEFIDFCYSNLDEKLAKSSVNSMIGAFNINLQKNVKWTTKCIVRNINEAFERFINNAGSFIKTFEIKDETYYHVFNKNFSEKMETEAPIYHQIVQIENIELHKLAIIIEQNNGQVLDLKTDCIACVFKNNINPFTIDSNNNNGTRNINGFYFDNSNKVHKYKFEASKRLEFGRMEKHCRSERFSHTPKLWNVINDGNRDDLVKYVMEKNTSLNIDGVAGTGKTTFLNKLKNKIKENGKTYTCMAPTNKACTHIEGKTLHKFMNTVKITKSIYDNIKSDYLIIDEISMVPELVYKFLLAIKHAKPDIIFIMAGDFQQHKPVNDRIGKGFDYKNSIALNELCDGNRIQLTDCYRADKEYYYLYHPDNIGNVRKDQFNNEFTDRHISYTNKKRVEVNKIMMEKKLEELKLNHENELRRRKRKITEFTDYIKLDKIVYDANSQDVILTVDTPIIAKINRIKDKKGGGINVINNEDFIITKLSGDEITFKNCKGKEQVVKTNEFQKIFYPAYCITSHASQGCTYDFKYTIHQWNRMDDTTKYVSLSRSTKQEYVNLI